MSLVDRFSDVTDCIACHEGETLYSLGLRLRQRIEQAIETSPDELDGLTDLKVAWEDVMELFDEHDRLSMPLDRVVALIPSRLAEHAE